MSSSRSIADTAQVMKWYRQAQPNYQLLFLQVYISYNAWYQEVTGTTNNRQAINQLKQRFVIWDDYVQGAAMEELQSYMKRLSEVTQENPLHSSHDFWTGEIHDKHDWGSLIEFWYHVRCLTVHGSKVDPLYVRLAYETLNIFMGEIIRRMSTCFSREDEALLYSLTDDQATLYSALSIIEYTQQELFEKYIMSPNIWQVDMQTVST